jgi:predicted  nucleic acid-binding Zn-ribbon protein
LASQEEVFKTPRKGDDQIQSLTRQIEDSIERLTKSINKIDVEGKKINSQRMDLEKKRNPRVNESYEPANPDEI